MSNQDTITITSNPNGTFTVETPKGAHDAQYENKGGCDIVTFGHQQAAEQRQGPAVGEAFRSSEGTIEVNMGGPTRILNAARHQEGHPQGDNFNILSGITTLSGRPEFDLAQVKANPAKYKARIGGTEASVESLLRSGLLQISGDGQLKENVERKMAALRPNDPSNPAIDRPKPVERMLLPNHLSDAAALEIKRAGLDPADIFAKALVNGNSAAKAVADGLGDGTTAEDVHELILDAARTTLVDAGVLLEGHDMAPEGQGAEVVAWVMNKCSPGVAKRLFHAILLGDKRAYEEITRRFANKEKF